MITSELLALPVSTVVVWILGVGFNLTSVVQWQSCCAKLLVPSNSTKQKAQVSREGLVTVSTLKFGKLPQ